MASSKKGGDINVLQSDIPKAGGKGFSSRPSRSGLSKNLTLDEVKQAVQFQIEAATRNQRGSSSTPSTGNSARIVKGEL